MKIKDDTFIKKFNCFQYTTWNQNEVGTFLFSLILRSNKAYEFQINLRQF